MSGIRLARNKRKMGILTFGLMLIRQILRKSERYITMSGQMKNYNNYYKQLETMDLTPVSAKDLPHVKLDIRGAIAYAKKLGKQVFELTDEEKQRFMRAY